MAGCQYGETCEPDPPAGVDLGSGWENAARPIVIAPAFPAPELGRARDLFDVKITAIGPTAVGHLDDVWESFRVAGADLAIGLGDDHIPFDVERGKTTDSVVSLVADAATQGGGISNTQEQPPSRSLRNRPPPSGERWEEDPPRHAEWAPSGSRARVRIALTSPLFLTETFPDGRKRTVLEPTFGQLIRAELRTLGPLHKLYGEPIPDDLFRRVKVAAEAVPTIRGEFAEFRQERFSNRSKDRYEVVGVIGWAEYGPVPEWLRPWAEWAGRLHVGTHRVAGAGGWTTE